MPNLRTASLFLAALLVVACGDSTSPGKAGEPGASGPGAAAADLAKFDKVILFTVDTLRPDQLGVYGAKNQGTPNIDAFASEARVFDHAYSQASLTVPALSSIFTGLHPRRHGIHGQRGALANNVVTLPEIVRRRKIPTASFIANICVLQPEPRTVFHDGWDVRYCGMDEESEQYLWDIDVVSHAIEWLQKQDGPFLLWVHLMDPHAEHRPDPEDWDYAARPLLDKFPQYEKFFSWEEARTFPDEKWTQHMWDLYAAEIHGADRQFGRFIAEVDQRDDADEIAVLFAADHGEELYESWSRFDHGLSLSEGVEWVPLMLRAKGLEPGVDERIVETLQITPTILQLMDLPEPYRLDGKSLLAPNPSTGYALSSVGKISISLRTKDYRFWFRSDTKPFVREEAQWRADAPWFTQRMTLARYPHEKRTTVEYLDIEDPANAAVVKELGEMLRTAIESMGEIPNVRQVGDADTEAEFAKLGYTGYADLSGD
jgi:arylsulfatase A-like enzyme